jgi:hypothetical protein
MQTVTKVREEPSSKPTTAKEPISLRAVDTLAALHEPETGLTPPRWTPALQQFWLCRCPLRHGRRGG